MSTPFNIISNGMRIKAFVEQFATNAFSSDQIMIPSAQSNNNAELEGFGDHKSTMERKAVDFLTVNSASGFKP